MKLLKVLVRAFIETNVDLLSYSICVIGTWYDEEENTSWLDVSIILEDKSIAEELGNEYNQIVIFDLLNEKVIELNGDGELPEDKIALSEAERLRSIIPTRGE